MARPIVSPFIRRLVESHQYQRKSNDCGPFSAAIVLNALLGLQIDGTVLAREMNEPYWKWILPIIRRIPGWMTFPWGMVNVFRDYGLASDWRLLMDEATLLRNLGEGKAVLPVMGGWKPAWAHIAVLGAYHDRLGWGLINPARRSAGVQWMPGAEFLRTWKAMGRIVIRAGTR